jgi:hypothetical protein
VKLEPDGGRARDASVPGRPASSVPRRAVGVLAVLAVLGSVLPLLDGKTARPGLGTVRLAQASLAPGEEAYRGLGTWVDIYDDAAWADPEGAVAAMASHGVRTLYLQTSNYRRGRTIVFRSGVERFLDAAHDAGLRVVAWYLPGFDDIDRDFHRVMAAIELATARGERFDSFALDIEAPLVTPASLRTRRLLDLSARIRAAVGDAYPLGAIIPSPRAMQIHQDYWPGFPYQSLASLYDVFVPMTYFTWRTSGLAGAQHYATIVTQIVRTQTGDRSVPIHVIGGISDDATTEEARGFVRAVREQGVIGASFYGFPGTTDGHWAELAAVSPNPVQFPALPVPLSYRDALGNIPDGDTTHPKEVFYRTAGRAGEWMLSFEAFDVQPDEVELWVNWRRLAMLEPTPGLAWGAAITTLVPDSWLRDDGPNTIAFVARGADPDWSVWGVRAVQLSPDG